MKRLRVFLVAFALLLVTGLPVARLANAGMMCDAAAAFEWKSHALNGHCVIEWLWEHTL